MGGVWDEVQLGRRKPFWRHSAARVRHLTVPHFSVSCIAQDPQVGGVGRITRLRRLGVTFDGRLNLLAGWALGSIRRASSDDQGGAPGLDTFVRPPGTWQRARWHRSAIPVGVETHWLRPGGGVSAGWHSARWHRSANGAPLGLSNLAGRG